jgi:lysophospholipase L1-like esterase
MRDQIQKILLVIIIITFNLQSYGQVAEYPGPERFEEAIQKFEAEDRDNPPPPGAIVCTGSSSMRGWHENIKEDLAPLTLIPRGFGGSNMNDALHYAERIMIKYAPRAIVLYEGDNDIAQKIPPQNVVGTFRLFVNKIHSKLPDCRIYVLSVKPSISRWSMWPAMKETNRLLKEECLKKELLTFVDVASPMLNDEGEPVRELFLEDNLHMNRKGYILWRDILRPVLIEKELSEE